MTKSPSPIPGRQRIRRRFTAGLLLASALVLAASGISGAATEAHATAAIPDVTILFPRALKVVRRTHSPEYARVVMYEADGFTAGGGCNAEGCYSGAGANSAAGVIGWRFVLDNGSSHSRILTATLDYGPPPRRFGRVHGDPAPFLEDVVIHRAPKMTLARALRLLRRAGHHGAFFDVTLRNPLGPRVTAPQYIFGLAREYFAVDTVTGRVTRVG